MCYYIAQRGRLEMEITRLLGEKMKEMRERTDGRTHKHSQAQIIAVRASLMEMRERVNLLELYRHLVYEMGTSSYGDLRPIALKRILFW